VTLPRTPIPPRGKCSLSPKSSVCPARTFAASLASIDGLPPDLTQQQAADVCWAYMDASLYRRLVLQCPWSTERFTRWLTDHLAATLLGS
jgi:hypothetical protein